MKVHVLDDWFDTLRGLPSFAMLDGHEVTVWTDHTEDVEVLGDRLAGAEALVLFRERTPMTDALLARLPNLRLIAMRGAYPHVDVEACTRHGVTFCSNRTAGAFSVAAAELTFALILALARQLSQQIAALKAGRWQSGVGQTLAGRTLGIYGYGGIGKAVAGFAQAFGMRVTVWGSEAGRARARADGLTVPQGRAAFFADSDFVSLHVRLTARTRGIVTAEDLLSMKPSAGFVNTARSGLVAPGALETALKAGRPGRIAVDVFDVEPITDATDPLLYHPAVIATPHIGYVTEDELDRQFRDIYEQVNAFATGAPIHVVNGPSPPEPART